MPLNSLRFYQTPGVQALEIVHLDVAASLIAKEFIGKEEFLVFEYREGKTVITDGNDTILATMNPRIFSKKVWAIYSEEEATQYYTFLLPEEY